MDCWPFWPKPLQGTHEPDSIVQENNIKRKASQRPSKHPASACRTSHQHQNQPGPHAQTARQRKNRRVKPKRQWNAGSQHNQTDIDDPQDPICRSRTVCISRPIEMASWHRISTRTGLPNSTSPADKRRCAEFAASIDLTAFTSCARRHRGRPDQRQPCAGKERCDLGNKTCQREARGCAHPRRQGATHDRHRRPRPTACQRHAGRPIRLTMGFGIFIARRSTMAASLRIARPRVLQRPIHTPSARSGIR